MSYNHRVSITSTASYTLDDQIQVYGNNTYTYDDDGYLVQKATSDGTHNYTYGSLGELRSVTTPTASIEYLYNANNQRVAKKVNGTIVEKYLWANLTTLLAIYDKDDNLIQRFEYSDGRMPTAMTQNNTKYYLHYDQVGSLRAVSDISGNIIKEITYDTYGNILTDTNANFKVPFGFAGGLYDSDTKLTRFGYRDYDSYTGKWTAKDPIDFAGGDTNLYGYVLGDPVNFVDPSGLFMDTLDNPIGVAAALLTTSAYGYYLMYTALDDYFQNHPIYWDFPTYDEPNSPVCESKGDKMLSPGEIEKLKKGGIDPHDLKENSKQDLYKDKDGNIFVKPKGGNGPGEPTGLNTNDF